MSKKVIGATLIKNVEPVKRMVGGKFGWAVHRFPINGGITIAEIWRESLYEAANRRSFFSRLLDKHG
jgi:hypothetical protein